MQKFLTYFTAIALAALASTSALYATGTDTWTGGGADNNWSTAGNWTGTNTPPVSGPGVGDDLVFDGTTRLTPNNDFAPNGGFSSVTFAAGAGAFDLQGNGFGFDFTQPGNSTLENDSPNTQTLDMANNAGFDSNAGFYVDGVHSFVNAAVGNIVINSNVELTTTVAGQKILTFEGAGTTTVNGLIYQSVIGFSSAPAGIQISGPGTVVLTNNGNLYTGGTQVDGGTLVVGGSAVLGDFGAFNDLTLNGGTVMTPLDAPLAYQVYNNFNHNGGTLFMQIGSNVTGVNNDEMFVAAAANLDPVNSLLFVHRVPSTQIFSPGDTVTIIATGTGVNGQFSNAPPGSPAPNDFNQLIQPFAVYNAFTVDLVFNFAASFASIGRTPNQIATGEALDDALAAGQIVNATTLLGNQSINTLRHIYDLIAPEELASMYEASFSQSMEQSLNIQRRLDDLRWGATGFCNEGFAITDNHGYSKDGKSVVDKNPVEQAAPPSYNWGSFATGYGELSKVGDEGDNAAGYQLNNAGFTMGADYRFGGSFAIGIAGGYTHTTGELVNDGRLNTDGGRIGLYGTWYADGFYVDGSAMGGWNQYDTRRTAYLGTEQGSTNGAEFDGMVAAGYDWKSGCWAVGPYADFEYDYVEFKSFTEGDTSLIPLHYPDQNQNAYRSDLGFRIAHQQNYKPGEGLNVVPQVRVAWRHDFGPTSYGIDSNFVGANETFTVHGPYVGRDSAVVNIGLTAYCTEQLSAYINYDGQFGRDNYNNNAISGGLRYDF